MSGRSSFPETERDDGLRYGVLMLTRGDRKRLRACLRSILAYNHAPARVAIVDRGEHQGLEAGDTPDLGLPVHYWGTGDDLGVAGSIEVGLRYLGDCEAVLFLDDATELGSRAPDIMLAGLVGPVGAVVGQLACPGLKKLTRRSPSRFSWFPLLLSLDAVNSVGPPLAQLFSGYDDWEYGLRVSRHGYSIAYRPVEIMRRQRGERSPVDTYLMSRNLLYLMTRRRPWSLSAFRDWARFSAIAFMRPSHPERFLVRRGFYDGLRGRLGPPPPDITSVGNGEHDDSPAERYKSE